MNVQVTSDDTFLNRRDQKSVLPGRGTSNGLTSGANDVELLVDPRSSSQVQAILLKRGFKPCAPRGEPAAPGVVHYCGLDAAADVICVHLVIRDGSGDGIAMPHAIPVAARNGLALQSGGAVITFIGPEASGKSTFIAECREWLGEKLPVSTLHLGKPSALWTRPENLLIPLIKKVFPRLERPRHTSTNISSASATSPRRHESFSFLHAIRAVSIARDRLVMASKARRMAQSGTIVLCDRYPSASASIDGPRLSTGIKGKGFARSLYRWLASMEQRLYQQVPPPDVVIQLSVSLPTTLMRNRARVKIGKESDAYIEFRYRQYQGWRSSRAESVHVIDGEQDLPEVLRKIKQVIWESLR